jgi:hypothetical protein
MPKGWWKRGPKQHEFKKTLRTLICNNWGSLWANTSTLIHKLDDDAVWFGFDNPSGIGIYFRPTCYEGN